MISSISKKKYMESLKKTNVFLNCCKNVGIKKVSVGKIVSLYPLVKIGLFRLKEIFLLQRQIKMETL